MTTQRCRVCDEKGAPVEGMTGQCKFCGEIFCLGHLTWSSHNCQPKFNLDEFHRDNIFFWTRHDEHGYCSNFWRAPIEISEKVYPTTEHYFQACKAMDLEEREMIRTLSTPKEAKFAGYHVKLRPDWEKVKEGVMLVGLRAKFTQHLDLKEKLLSTGNAALHEDSPWDKYWGYVKGKGKDRLGILLMQVREELR